MISFSKIHLTSTKSKQTTHKTIISLVFYLKKLLIEQSAYLKANPIKLPSSVNYHILSSTSQTMQLSQSTPKDIINTFSDISQYEEYPLNQHIISDKIVIPQRKSTSDNNQPQTSHTRQESELPSDSSDSLVLQSEDNDLIEIESELDLSKDEDEDDKEQSNDQDLPIDQRRRYKDIDGPMEIDNSSDAAHAKLRKRKNARKIRTTITREKLAKMNEIFAEYWKNKEEGKSPKENLKEIGISLSLGYSTILHKFRQFRAHKIVKGGALIASLQKKRKYKKSKQIEAIIQRALASGPFYTAVQLSDYIYQKEGKRYSRSIISRHLGQMGYSYKNLKSSPIEKNKPAFKQNRRVYASIMLPLLHDPNMVILYIDELACSVATFQRRRVHLTPKELFNQNPTDYVSVLIGATCFGIIGLQVKRGFYSQQQFIAAMIRCIKYIIEKYQIEQKQRPNILVVTDLNKIHLDPQVSNINLKPVKSALQSYNSKRYYLPPSSPHLNPIESMFANIKGKLFKKEIQGPYQLQQQMKKCTQDLFNQQVDVYFEDVQKCLKEIMGEETKCEGVAENSLSCETTK